MKKTGKSKDPEEVISEFIVVNEMGDVWVGLKGDQLSFSQNWNDAKSLKYNQQFTCLTKMTYFKLEKLYI